MPVIVKCFSYTPHASFGESVSLAHPMLVIVSCFSYILHASFSEVFLLHS